MILVTKIFRFEMAHALNGYPGACQYVHGHSYELHVTVSASSDDEYMPAPGFEIDFKQLKKLIKENVIDVLDHSLLLSPQYIDKHPGLRSHENLVVLTAEPSAENLLIYISDLLKKLLPRDVRLQKLKLYETSDSYAEWVCSPDKNHVYG